MKKIIPILLFIVLLPGCVHKEINIYTDGDKKAEIKVYMFGSQLEDVSPALKLPSL